MNCQLFDATLLDRRGKIKGLGNSPAMIMVRWFYGSINSPTINFTNHKLNNIRRNCMKIVFVDIPLKEAGTKKLTCWTQ